MLIDFTENELEILLCLLDIQENKVEDDEAWEKYNEQDIAHLYEKISDSTNGDEIEMNEKALEILQKEFNKVTRTDEGDLQLETKTSGGIDIVIELYEDIIACFNEYVEEFDVDEVVDTYMMEDEEYSETHFEEEAYNDVNEFYSKLQKIAERLNNL